MSYETKPPEVSPRARELVSEVRNAFLVEAARSQAVDDLSAATVPEIGAALAVKDAVIARLAQELAEEREQIVRLAKENNVQREQLSTERDELQRKLAAVEKRAKMWEDAQEATRQGGQNLAKERDTLARRVAELEKQLDESRQEVINLEHN